MTACTYAQPATVACFFGIWKAMMIVVVGLVQTTDVQEVWSNFLHVRLALSRHHATQAPSYTCSLNTFSPARIGTRSRFSIGVIGHDHASL